jgi:hypothetical protein
VVGKPMARAAAISGVISGFGITSATTWVT